MISNMARALAARRLSAIERQLLPGASATPEVTDLERRIAALLHQIEQSHREQAQLLSPQEVNYLAARSADLELRALDAERGWLRMRSRRLYRVVNVLAAMARRPWKGLGLMGDLRAAFERRSIPYVEPKSAEMFSAEMATHRSSSKPRPFPYPHIRVAHAGRLTMFGRVAPHLHLTTIDLARELATGFDMLVIEPGVDDPLDEVQAGIVSRFKEADIPVLFIARTSDHLDYPILPQADLILTEDPELAEQAIDRGMEVLHIHPSVDDTIHNPIGWKHHPDPTLLIIADHSGIETDLETLAPITDRISLHGPTAIPGLNITHHIPERPIGADQARTAKNHLAAYTTPQLTATETSHIQLVLELMAAGTPVITAPNPTLTTLVDNHYLAAANTSEILDRLEGLQHPPTRERHSVAARRHVLTHHTRKHRFEDVLTHLNIPTNPRPRVSIVLATKRPDYVEHALVNVTKQNWENKDLLLILHGTENFDLPHIQSLTSRLPYPTQIIPCPSKWTLGDCLNIGVAQAVGTYVTKMDDDDYYGSNHLTDLITAHTYSNADIAGKFASIVHLAEFNLTVSREVVDSVRGTIESESFHYNVSGSTITGRRELLVAYRFLRLPRRVDTTLFERLVENGHRIYVTHPYGFIAARHDSGHSWQVNSHDYFTRNAIGVQKGVAEEYLNAG